MYSFIAISDIHLGQKLFNRPELAQDLYDYFVKACDLALEKKVDYLFVVGDLFDKNTPTPDLIKFVQQQVRRLNINGIMVAGIAGDHDKPVNNAAWVHLTDIIPITQADLQEHKFLGFDYQDRSQDNVGKLKKWKYRESVEWIFLHGQAIELFPYCEEKKKLDFKEFDLLETFPKLKGVILGDIHQPLHGTISDPAGKRPDAYIGYCGSLGIIKTDEVGTKEGVLYYDGKELKRIPFPLDREFIRVNLGDSIKPINWVKKYYRFFKGHKGKLPVFLVEHDRSSKHLLPEVAMLYDVGIVIVMVSKKMSVDKKEETINLRSELKTSDRMEQALRQAAPEKEVYDELLALLTSDDPKAVLDKLKQRTLVT